MNHAIHIHGLKVGEEEILNKDKLKKGKSSTNNQNTADSRNKPGLHKGASSANNHLKRKQSQITTQNQSKRDIDSFYPRNNPTYRSNQNGNPNNDHSTSRGLNQNQSFLQSQLSQKKKKGITFADKLVEKMANYVNSTAIVKTLQDEEEDDYEYNYDENYQRKQQQNLQQSVSRRLSRRSVDNGYGAESTELAQQEKQEKHLATWHEEDNIFKEQAEEMTKKNNISKLLVTVEKNDFEVLQMYHDNYPFLAYRKFFILVQKIISWICRIIILHPLFDHLVLAVILFNTVILMQDDPNDSTESQTVQACNLFFLYFYLFECILKIVAMGFLFNKNSYLRDGWNIMDFIIVVTSFMSEMNEGDNSISALRSLRVLRPLRTVSTVKALRVIMVTLFAAIPQLLNTIIVLLFFFLVFAIAGLQLFSGILMRRCFEIETGLDYEPGEAFEPYICGGSKNQCPDGFLCGKQLSDPNDGVTNFNNIFYSLIMAFVCVTMEGWTEIMYWVFDAYTEVTFVYFFAMIWIGSFFLLNLTLAVIKAQFSNTQDNSKNNKSLEDIEEVEKVDL